MPTRINKSIELLEQDQPIYYVGSHSGAELTYEAGRRMANTFADYINIGMEHGAFDMAGLDQFMRGLVAGGPTNSGHRTPAVIVEVPVDGASEEIIRANAWQMRQILSRGVHGILLCHAENPGAVKAFVESCRYPFNTIGVGYNLGVGRRGGGGQAAPSGDMGSVAGRLPAEGRPVAAEPRRGAHAGAQDREQAGAGERGAHHAGAGHRLRRVGAG